MDIGTIIKFTLLMGGAYLILTFLEKFLIKRKAKQLAKAEDTTNDNRTSDTIDRTDDNQQ